MRTSRWSNFLEKTTLYAERNIILALCLFPAGLTAFEIEKLVSANSEWFGNFADLSIFKKWTVEDELKKYLNETFLDLIKLKEVVGVSQSCYHLDEEARETV